jgi:hypothetical protein
VGVLTTIIECQQFSGNFLAPDSSIMLWSLLPHDTCPAGKKNLTETRISFRHMSVQSINMIYAAWCCA